MVSKAANTLSAGAVAAAKTAGRFYKGRVYGTKAQAQQARRDAASSGSGGNGGGGSRKKGAAAVQMESRVVVVDSGTFSIGTTLVNKVCRFRGSDAHADLLALGDAKVLGVRLQVVVPLTTAKVRWVVAPLTSLSAGDKTTTQVASVKGSQTFSDGDFIDKWVTVGGMAGKINPLKADGTSAVEATELRLAVVALEATAAVASVQVKWHVTVATPKSNAGVSSL